MINVFSKIKSFIQEHKKMCCVFLLVLCICFAYWLLFANVYDNTGTANDARNQLNTAQEEQQRATESIEQIQSGIDDSIETVGSIEQSNNEAKDTADDITDTNTNINTAITNAQDSITAGTGLIDDSQRRIEQSLTIIEDIRAGAK
jgi:methyl-accepting chemotaxis protein|nr:MAG TPA: PilA, PilC, PilN, PilO, PilM, pilus, ring, membrane channel [Caudoviricetes sp.]